MTTGKCRGCGAEVIWAETITGRHIPVDVEPNESGDIVLGLRHEGMPLALVQIEQSRARLLASGEKLFVQHKCQSK